MAEPHDQEMTLEDEYDEEADSDFETEGSDAEDPSSASDDEGHSVADAPARPHKRRKTEKTQEVLIAELDSGDEATIRAQKKDQKKGENAKGAAAEDAGNQSEEWRARTRAMRIKEKEERTRRKLASSKGSTIDVDKIWEEMNRPAPLPPPRIEDDGEAANQAQQSGLTDDSRGLKIVSGDGEKENLPANNGEETITIKRTYKFAGEVHVEEKTVLRSSAEAQLWLSQQRPSEGSGPAADGKLVSRPLRRFSRFDPNLSNMDAYKGSWGARNTQDTKFRGPKLNVVEKSKMDWAEHVDSEGLKDELDLHAKAKEGYLTRMDFLREVEERRDAEARAARLRAR
ncbi:hypothetical protein G647_05783 [Cladophialophora carrionii CBS 160.54]|uniref:SWR1-complex protein 5 n=1 Tax=Cladophialophora carrionii CBS 160.54 TaxID=1279043 RepID=V9DBB7_9EURO|nr:uncharacterized protein G647_05783 [Cladophialophora carrionii CBS 160.54]ETI23976.1 hypothetical protein G647_05783 [Cladophialophora carrionii CBS 160.54]